MKTIKEWFLLLPEPWKTRAVYNHESQQFNIGKRVASFPEALGSGFEWGKTPKEEGISYWVDCPEPIESPTNALSAIHAIALKKGFPADSITSIRHDVHGIWLYSVIDNPSATFSINLSNESNG